MWPYIGLPFVHVILALPLPFSAKVHLLLERYVHEAIRVGQLAVTIHRPGLRNAPCSSEVDEVDRFFSSVCVSIWHTT